MKSFLLLLFVVETINGFGFQMPFHMQFEIPAYPAMSAMPAMPFPSIFNPMEAMERETMEPETRGLDEPNLANLTTKNNTETKDGFKVTTITRDGPGFHSYIKEYQKEGNSTKNGTGSEDLAKLMGGPNLFEIMKQLSLNRAPKKKKCKKCNKGKFCDPIFHLCRKKFSEGRTCMFQKQCGKKLRCQWGKCQKGKAGDAGTFCKNNAQCNGNACCRNTPGSFHLMCIPRQAEGAICGLNKQPAAASSILYLVKRSTPTCSPCEDGLKCAETGNSEYKRCVRDAYVEKAADDLEDDNPSNALDDDEEDKDHETPEPLKGIPPPSPPNTSSNNPIEDEDDDDKEGEKEDASEEKESGDDKDVKEADNGIVVQEPPKKGKKEEKEGKKKKSAKKKTKKSGKSN